MARNRSAIALDFGGYSVKALQLEGRGERLRVRCAHMARIATSPTQTPAERRAQTIEAGRRVLREASFRGRSAVVALSLGDIQTRRLRIPTDKLAQAGEIIAREIQDQPTAGQDLSIVPIAVADLFDHGEMKREFLCCITRAAAIDELIAVTEAIGLVPEAIDLEPCAQVRPFARRAQQDCFLHLDIGRQRSRITIVRAGVTVLMKSCGIGSEPMLATLGKRLQLDIDDLVELGAAPGEQRELHEAVTGALAEPLETLLLEVSAAVRYVGALFQGRAVTLMRVAGGIAALPGLAPYLGRRIGITTEVADPFTEIETGPVTTSTGGTRSSYCTVLGLALRGVA
jgi:type IV pilus assembly protein PilM